MRWHVAVCLLAAAVCGCATERPKPAALPYASKVWAADKGDGTYRNPILFADYSDPDVIRVADDFYMTASSFNCVPGLPILHSKDLVNWEIIGHAVQRFKDKRFDLPQHGNGLWAPSIRFRDGWFWIFVGDPDTGILMTKALNPAGPWTPLHVVKEGKGLIDPCPLWDDNGNAYLLHAWADGQAGINGVLTVNQMSPDGTKLLDEGRVVYEGRSGLAPTLSGRKFYKRSGWYYIFAPTGGAGGWQVALRSKNVLGPYETRQVLEQGSASMGGPHQGGWVDLKSGESWFLHSQDRDAYGRVVHLDPVRWVEDWPLIGEDADRNGVGEPVTTANKPNVGVSHPIMTPVENDEFDSIEVGLQWQWQADPQQTWTTLKARPGWLRLHAAVMPSEAKNLGGAPNLLLQKLPAPAFSAMAQLDAGGLGVGHKTGLLIMGQSYSYIGVERTTSGLRLIRATCREAAGGAEEASESTTDLVGSTVLLRVAVGEGAACTFSYSTDGRQFISLGRPFIAQAGKGIGAKVGLFCISRPGAPQTGYADYDWFRIE